MTGMAKIFNANENYSQYYTSQARFASADSCPDQIAFPTAAPSPSPGAAPTNTASHRSIGLPAFTAVIASLIRSGDSTANRQ